MAPSTPYTELKHHIVCIHATQKAAVVRGTTASGVFRSQSGKMTQNGMSHSLIKALNSLKYDPEPIWDLDYLKRPKFQIWSKDSQGYQEEV